MKCIAPTLFAAALAASPAAAQDHQHAEPAPPAEAAPADHQHMDHSQMDHGAMDAIVSHHVSRSTLGSYSMSRDGSGTSWIPEAAPMAGAHFSGGGWSGMGHVVLNGAYTDQGGPRGGEKAFVSGMVMGMAQRSLGPGTLGVKAMLSPEPFMGKSGYPLLLAAGETADGEETLVDRQHPHDLFMELAASYSVPLGDNASLFLYGGLPGEPAFGPPAFMHRPSGMDAVEAPITHHWLDSTHIVFGVVTAGVTAGPFKLDASRFRGREPDEKRFDIETGSLDSSAVRLSYNPTPNWALQTSWASIKSPEALEPHHDERRVSASAMYARPVGDSGLFSATAAWARKDKVPGEVLNAALLEAAFKPNAAWTFFGRGEQVEQDELGEIDHGPAYTVRKLSLGAIRDFAVTDLVTFGVGAQVSAFDIEEPLGASYGNPTAATVFVRLKVE